MFIDYVLFFFSFFFDINFNLSRLCNIVDYDIIVIRKFMNVLKFSVSQK